MPAEVIVSDDAERALQEIACSRAEFDRGAGYAYLASFLKTMRLVACGALLHQIVGRFSGANHHRAVVENTTVLYVLYDEVVFVTSVFGPGRDWQSEL